MFINLRECNTMKKEGQEDIRNVSLKSLEFKRFESRDK